MNFRNPLLHIPVFFMLMVSCNELFEYSPYDTDTNKRHLNSREVKSITENSASSDDTFKFALLSDIHDNYDDLSAAIRNLNHHNDLRFVICCGDITNSGLSQQFDWYVDEIEKSDYPFFSMIGNHDYRSNGLKNYRKIFGQVNSSFVVDGYKFILFDNTIWENENRSPIYSWLSEQLADSENYNIVFCHIPPWGDQMAGKNDTLFREIVRHDNTILCAHGHTHNFQEIYYNGIHTLVSAAINDREYYIISFSGNTSVIQRVNF
jgi:3',5'-cyclic-AMP phosphodiesterase